MYIQLKQSGRGGFSMSIALKMKNCKAVTNGLSLSSKVAYGCGDAACNVVWGGNECVANVLLYKCRSCKRIIDRDYYVALSYY